VVIHLSREKPIAAHKLEELLGQRSILLHTKHQCEIGPGAMRIHDHFGFGETLDVVEQKRRAGLAPGLIDRSARGGEVRLEAHRVGDPQELLVGFQKLEKIAKRLESPHRNLTTPDGSALN